jgi:hypothetical protein
MLRFWKKQPIEPVVFHCAECKIPLSMPVQRLARHVPHCHTFQKERLTQNAIVQPNFFFEDENGHFYLNNQDKRHLEFKDGIKKGCCGVPANPNDLNLQCQLGHNIGAECSECYMMQFVLLHQDRVETHFEDENGLYALLNHDFLLHAPNHIAQRKEILRTLHRQPNLAFEHLTDWMYNVQYTGNIPKDIIELLHTANERLKKDRR